MYCEVKSVLRNTQIYFAYYVAQNHNIMDYNKLKLALAQSGVTHEAIANELDLTRQAVHSMLKKESMKVYQLESICKLAQINPAILFDSTLDDKKNSGELIQALRDKIALQTELLQLLREQLKECKAQFNIKATVK